MTELTTKKARLPRAHMRGHKIEVTAETIAAATLRDSGHCMVAEAIKVAIPSARNVSVDLATIRYTDAARRVRYTYLTPPFAQRALVNFDQGDATEPFVFSLRRAAQIQPLRDRQKKKVEGLQKDGRDSVPTVIGGVAMPHGPLAGGSLKANVKLPGRIRAFGLRQLRP